MVLVYFQMNEGFGNDFQYGFPGDLLFIYEPNQMDLRTPNFLREQIGIKSFSIARASQNCVDSLAAEFLTSGFLIDLALRKKLVDPATMDWLLNCVCFSSKLEVVEAAFNALWAFITSEQNVSSIF